jgi:arabinofuranan 3-O-arabinosyltransferase
VLGEGHSDGWTATAAGSDLGAPRLVDGGFNGWYLPPRTSATTVELDWTPQPVLTVALVLSGLAALACILLVVADRRRHPMAAPGAPRLTTRWSGRDRRQLAVVVAVWVLVAALVVEPWWGLVAAAIGAVAVLLRSMRVIGVVAIGMAAVGGVTVVLRVVRDRPFPNAGWVLHFEDLHRPGLFLVTALLASALLTDREPSSPGEP